MKKLSLVLVGLAATAIATGALANVYVYTDSSCSGKNITLTDGVVDVSQDNTTEPKDYLTLSKTAFPGKMSLALLPKKSFGFDHIGYQLKDGTKVNWSVNANPSNWLFHSDALTSVATYKLSCVGGTDAAPITGISSVTPY